MGFRDSSLNRIGLLLFILVIWVFLVAATAAPNWGKGSGYHAGLWSACVNNGGGCGSIDCSGTGICSTLKAARAFLVMAILAVSFAFILGCVQACGYLNHLHFVTTGLLAVGFVFTLIGWACGTRFGTYGGATADACVGLGVIAWVFLAVAVAWSLLSPVDAYPKAFTNNATTAGPRQGVVA
jgi:hypothetical protein